MHLNQKKILSLMESGEMPQETLSNRTRSVEEILAPSEIERIQKMLHFIKNNPWSPVNEMKLYEFHRPPQMKLASNIQQNLLKAIGRVIKPLKNWFTISEYEKRSVDITTVKYFNAKFAEKESGNNFLTFFHPLTNSIYVKKGIRDVRSGLQYAEIHLNFLPEWRSNFMKKMKHLFVLPWPYGIFPNKKGEYENPLHFKFQIEKPLPVICRYWHFQSIVETINKSNAIFGNAADSLGNQNLKSFLFEISKESYLISKEDFEICTKGDEADFIRFLEEIQIESIAPAERLPITEHEASTEFLFDYSETGSDEISKLVSEPVIEPDAQITQETFESMATESFLTPATNEALESFNFAALDLSNCAEGLSTFF